MRVASSVLVLLLGATCGLTGLGSARAEAVAGRCGPEARGWTAACALTSGAAVEAVLCLADRAVLEVRLFGEPLRVEVRADPTGAVASGGGMGLFPVGEFGDWAAQPAGRREAVEALGRCLAADPSLLSKAAGDARHALDEGTGKRPTGVAEPAPAQQPAAGGGGPDPTARGLPALLAALLVLALAVALARRRADSLRALAEGVAHRWHGGPALTGALLLVLCAVEAWASQAADPDFFLPDPFHGFVAGLALLFLVAGFTPWAALRRTLVTLCFAVPAFVLVMEVYLAARDRSIASLRMAVSDDKLLRYTYRPGAEVRDAGGVMTVSADGLWDLPHAVPKPPGVLRVVVLGDSVPNDPSLAFAERFPSLLRERLAARAPAGTTVEVVNVSCEGYNTQQEERLFEKVGLRYQPDLVVLAYVLNDPFLQNGAYRRVGNSFFAFRIAETVGSIGRGRCALFAPLHRGYNFDLVVRASLERLRMATEPLHVPVVVATVPLVERFDDPVCLSLYDQVGEVARSQGFGFVRLVDAFAGTEAERFRKPTDRGDITHPNAEGHARIAGRLAEELAPRLFAR